MVGGDFSATKGDVVEGTNEGANGPLAAVVFAIVVPGTPGAVLDSATRAGAGAAKIVGSDGAGTGAAPIMKEAAVNGATAGAGRLIAAPAGA